MTAELENLYALARRAKADNNSENAAKYYEMILLQCPNDWEANFYTVYYQALSCRVGQIVNAETKILNNIDTVFALVLAQEPDHDKRIYIFTEIACMLSKAAAIFVNSSIGIVDVYRYSEFSQGAANASNTYVCCHNNAVQMLERFGDLVRMSGIANDSEIKQVVLPLYKICIDITIIYYDNCLPAVKKYGLEYSSEMVERMLKIIHEYEPDYENPFDAIKAKEQQAKQHASAVTWITVLVCAIIGIIVISLVYQYV